LEPINSEDIISLDLNQNEQKLRDIFTNCYDIVFRRIELYSQFPILLVYTEGLVNTQIVDEIILKPWMLAPAPPDLPDIQTLGSILEKKLVSIAKTKTTKSWSELIEGILTANLIILSEGSDQAVLAEIIGYPNRAITEPTTEVSMSGPKDSFTESIQLNTSMVRRKIRDPRLKMESLSLGTVSKTQIVIAYIDGIVEECIIEEVRNRVSQIKIDSVLGGNYIEEFIEDHSFTLFPQVQNSERPDIVASSLVERKVAIFIDGSPFVLIVPFTFWVGFQAMDDYYERFIYASCIRLLRMLFILITLYFPSMYVAITTFHPQLLPTDFLLSITSTREGAPFPTVIEALLMEFIFEGLREAGIRLPRPIGSAVSIVGGLVIGQAGVQAGLVSAPMVIVVSLTGIASILIPRYNMGIAFRMLRFPMLIFAGTLGLYGISMASLYLLIHLTNLKSFGIPYLSPVAPLKWDELKDVFVRVPRWSMQSLPFSKKGQKDQRIPPGQSPTQQKGES
jgi:hypothetical protein